MDKKVKLRTGRGFEHSDDDTFEELGIIRDQSVSFDDSVPIEDPSLNITDDETSANIFDASDFHLRRGESDDFTGVSEDISKASDHVKKSSLSTEEAQQEETESLTEFEEIEKLIQANIADDSDDDLSDIPADLEKRILSARSTRANSLAGPQAMPAATEHSSKPLSTSKPASSSSSKHSTVPDTSDFASTSNVDNFTHHPHHQHQDTGYISGGDQSTGTGSHTNRSVRELEDQVALGRLDESAALPDDHQPPPAEDDCEMYADETATSGERAQSDATLNFTTDADVSLERFMAADLRRDDVTPGNDDVIIAERGDDASAAEEAEPGSLVATFGTTEDFEKLLKQQLDSDHLDDDADGGVPIFHQQHQDSDPVVMLPPAAVEFPRRRSTDSGRSKVTHTASS